MKLKPPFSSNNPLLLAKKIVDLDFEPLTGEGEYSEELI